MTESEIKLVERLWGRGKTIGEIARLLPYKEYIAKRKIRELKQNGVLNGRSGKTQEKTQAKVLELYDMGITNPYEIAEILSMRVNSIMGILSKLKPNRKRPPHNWKRRKQTNFNKLSDKTQAIIAEIKDGQSLSKIAKTYKTSRQYVHKIKNKFVKEQGYEIEI